MHSNRKARTNTDIDINKNAKATSPMPQSKADAHPHTHTHEHVRPRAHLPVFTRTQKKVRRTRMTTHAQPRSGACLPTHVALAALVPCSDLQSVEADVPIGRPCPADGKGLCLPLYGETPPGIPKRKKHGMPLASPS